MKIQCLECGEWLEAETEDALLRKFRKHKKEEEKQNGK